ncbi:protein MODIFIER OF SNC1 1 [Senna tora]|uniref:Protein MODIFIER OF SNC1 1 n=1 Tax=Senna tora TaxID=362788 RepID=A0A835CDH4_9FABA|nr:protein MODIFIER OF SNC1 1 [Senna tora]
MTSNMLSGERRWASSRRSGMTVLGKVAVPKPINLPSQRLENHGLDPNVEIVPKLGMFVLLGVMCFVIILIRGTLSWGGKSSSASNAWGSSLSPNTDGGSSSSSGLGARPSSGGSGMRPSTAGSDRALEPTSYAWGSNSRPSSASGSLTSNQTSLRPRSAETRPGSSQLSRLTENHVAWSDARTAEKLGVAHGKNDEFSLSSGEFPTLGSEKEKLAENSELQDHSSHGRPSSSSGHRKAKTETSVTDDAPVTANLNDGAINSWKRDNPAYSEEGLGPSNEKWQGNPQHYPNASFPPQHYDAWHNPPINNPQGGVWFRGPPGGPQFGNPITPGGFPVEQFTYYGPHIPPTGLANPIVPPPGPGPRGPHRKNGDGYRSHMPDAYIRPGPSMPIRTGFYPGPLAYDGYYSPAMGFCNSNEQDVPYMAMSGPSVYNRYPNQNPLEPGNPRGRSGGFSSAERPLASDQAESSHPSDTGGPYRVLLKQHKGQDGRNDPLNCEDLQTENSSLADRRNHRRMSSTREVEQCSDYRKNEEIKLSTSTQGDETFSQTLEKQGSSPSVLVKAKSPERIANSNTAGDISARELDGPLGAASGVQEVLLQPSVPIDSSLIQKIEGLNAKLRDNLSARSREDQRNKIRTGNAPVSHVDNEDGISAGAVFPGTKHATEHINPSPPDVGSGGEKNPEYSSFHRTAPSRRTTHGMQGRNDHHNKGRYSNIDADGWQKKSVLADSSTSSDQPIEASNIHVGDHLLSVEMYKRSGPYHIHQARNHVESMQTVSDPTDTQAQRSKVKELAMQRTKQLQVEEEERTRKQKAKALAKLDELNSRTKLVEESTQKENSTSSTLRNKQDEFQLISEASINEVEKSPILTSKPPIDTQKIAGKELNQLISHQDANSADAPNSIQVQDITASKPKQMGFKQKQKLGSTSITTLKVENDTMADGTLPSEIARNEIGTACGLGLSTNLTAMTESSVNQKKKNNRNGKNRHRVEETSSLAAMPLAVPKEGNISQNFAESNKPKDSESKIDQDSFRLASSSKDLHPQLEQHKYLPNEESHGRANSQWKSQYARRMPRNTQTTRPPEKSQGGDAVMWAPVKPPNKTGITDASIDNIKTDVVNSVKGDQQVHNNLKNKRAELERYIPKLVAKEMVQQGGIQQVASSNNQDAANECVGQADSGSQAPHMTQHTNTPVKVVSGVESKNRDGRQIKPGKLVGSWRQRGSAESSSVHDMQDGQNNGSKSDQSVQRSTEHKQTQKVESSLEKGHTKHVSDSSDPDGSNQSRNLRNEQHPSSGFRKNGNQNRVGRGHESHGDRKSSGQDNRQYSLPASRERQGQNLHYEYHPVGSNDNSQSEQFERPKDGNHTVGRLRERVQTHSRRGRGSFYGRQGGL